MMFKGKRIFNASFDVYANNYHSVRPGYPGELFKDINHHCGIDSGSRLLEIGAGSGIATAELAKLGCRVVAIEPGANLAAIARQQTQQFGNVEVMEGTFEDFVSDERFDAVMAFTAFHWLTDGDKFQQVADMLEDDGCLVLVWNSFFQSSSPATDEVNQAYRKFLPNAYPDDSSTEEVNQGVLAKLNRREQEAVSNRVFYPIFLRKYLSVYNYDADTYPKLLNTFPKIVEVEGQQRSDFLDHVSKIVANYGTISVPVLTTLIISQKRTAFIRAIADAQKE